ncbi:MAG TPA: hypothetical protein PLL33_13895 [Paracoccus sp. (in: a-proteobacteria)]|nr:hypothetical protein [Paracoccus sp. (in: a-proteobacteria)]
MRGARDGGGGPPADRLLALFAAALVALNFPLLLVWDRDATLFGLPLLGVALFVIWAALIAVLAWISERPGRRNGRRP